MKYFKVEFQITPFSSDASDVLAAMTGEAGLESFEETETGLKGYVQQGLLDETALREAVAEFPFEGVSITYDIHEAENRDWNEQWEQEGFEPIIVNSGLVIHDGRHLPADISSKVIAIEIDARQAFGTGTHETTRMICATLLEMRPKGRVLDCGTGTGILSICALKLGADEAVGYDIDEWSVDNARHNAVINRVDDRFTSLLGDSSILDNDKTSKTRGTFELVTANINRNILLADMPLFRRKMAPDARLILSGFYTEDAPMLIDKATMLGLTLESQKADNNWCCLSFRC